MCCKDGVINAVTIALQTSQVKVLFSETGHCSVFGRVSPTLSFPSTSCGVLCLGWLKSSSYPVCVCECVCFRVSKASSGTRVEEL